MRPLESYAWHEGAFAQSVKTRDIRVCTETYLASEEVVEEGSEAGDDKGDVLVLKSRDGA